MKSDMMTGKAGVITPAFSFGPVELAQLLTRAMNPGVVKTVGDMASPMVKVKVTRGRVVGALSMVLTPPMIQLLFPSMTYDQAGAFIVGLGRASREWARQAREARGQLVTEVKHSRLKEAKRGRTKQR